MNCIIRHALDDSSSRNVAALFQYRLSPHCHTPRSSCDDGVVRTGQEVRTRRVTALLQDRVSQKPHVSYSSLAQGRAAMTTSRNAHVRVGVAIPRTHAIAGSAM